MHRLTVAFSLVALGITSTGVAVPSVAGTSATYYLPAPAGTRLVVTNTPAAHNAANDSQYAIDFGFAGNASFDVAASRAGAVIGVRDNSTAQCYKTANGLWDMSCWRDANYVVVDHGDGTSALYMHLAVGTAVVKIGDRVVAGQKLGRDDNTGFSSGNHLHFAIETTPTVPSTPPPGPTDEVARAWWWTTSQPFAFSDPDVLRQATSGIPGYGMTVLSGTASSPVPGPTATATATRTPSPTPSATRTPSPTPTQLRPPPAPKVTATIDGTLVKCSFDPTLIGCWWDTFTWPSLGDKTARVQIFAVWEGEGEGTCAGSLANLKQWLKPGSGVAIKELLFGQSAAGATKLRLEDSNSVGGGPFCGFYARAVNAAGASALVAARVVRLN